MGRWREFLRLGGRIGTGVPGVCVRFWVVPVAPRIGCAFGVGFWQPSVCAVGALVVVGTVMGWSNQDEFRVSVDALRELSVS